MTASAGTLTLTEFLTARLDEDEAYGLALAHGNRPGLERPSFGIYDPRRVLAEVGAKRRIVELAQQVNVRQDGAWVLAHESYLRALALPYADHRDYREEWRP